MSKFIKELGWRLGLLLAGVILGPVLVELLGGRYSEFLKRQPQWILAVFVVVVAAAIVASLAIQRLAAIKKSNIDRQVPDSARNPLGMECFALLHYRKVNWAVVFESLETRYLLPGMAGYEPDREGLQRLRPDDIYVRYAPFCQKCHRRLEEWDTILGLYKWTCPDCHKSRLNVRRFGAERKRATVLARQEFLKIKSGKESAVLILTRAYKGAEKYIRAEEKRPPQQGAGKGTDVTKLMELIAKKNGEKNEEK